MSPSSRTLWGGIAVLDASTEVYRAVLYRSWLRGGIQPNAFFRCLRDTKGVSVNNPTSCTPAELCAIFQECFGVLRLNVGVVRSLELDIVPDLRPGPGGCDHGNITGLPIIDEDRDLAERIARRLASLATLEWQP